MSVRKDLEAELFSFLDDCDPSGKNTARLKSYLKPMSDKQFYEYFDEFFKNPDKYIQVGYEAYNNPVTVQFVEKLAKKHNVKLREIVYKPYITGDINNPPASVYPVLVMDVPIKRLKQMVAMKSHTSLTNTKRDAKTGQVTGHDKTARITEPEAYSLMVQECYACAQEAFGPMADDEAAYFEMQKRILRDGEVSLEDLPNDPINKVAMNTINAFIIGSGIVSNLLDESGYLLPITLKSQEENKNAIKR